MRVLAYRPNAKGEYDTVGMNNILPITDLTTVRGIKNRLVRVGWARLGQRIKLEIYGDSFYGEPVKTMNVILDYRGH